MFSQQLNVCILRGVTPLAITFSLQLAIKEGIMIFPMQIIMRTPFKSMHRNNPNFQLFENNSIMELKCCLIAFKTLLRQSLVKFQITNQISYHMI